MCLGDTFDNDLTAILEAAIDYVENYTNRNFSGEAVAVEDEEYLSEEARLAQGECWFKLNFDDARAVSAVKVVSIKGVETTLSNDKYRLVKPNNRIYIASRFNYGDIALISYAYGTANTPKMISQIVLAYSRMLANQSENAEISRELVTSERIGEHSIGVSASSDNLSSTKKVLDTQNKIDRALDQFRKFVMESV